MKKISLLLGLCAICASSFAQTPEKKSIALIHKITATWCGPCGDWGWDASEAIVAGIPGKGLYIGLFADSRSAYGNTDFYTQTARTLATQFATNEGIPDFGINGIASSANFTNGVGQDCISTATTFAATVPTASAASNLSISGNTVTVAAKSQFWSAASGEYYLAAYIVEDGAMHVQNGQGSAPVAHHGVLRASMTEASAWGVSIASGSINANQTYNTNFTFTITDTKWDKSKLKVYNVIWKKEGNKYKFVNASVTTSGAGSTAIEDVISNTSLNIFPSPAQNTLNVTLDAVKASAATFTVTDVMGRNIISQETNLTQGTNRQTINTSSLAPGVYFLNILTASGNTQKKFVKE